MFGLLLAIAVLLSSCGGERENRANVRYLSLSESDIAQIEVADDIRYAEGFAVRSFANATLVDIKDPAAASDNAVLYKYALVPRKELRDSNEPIEIPEGYQPIEVPIERAICMTTLQLSPFIKLGESDKVVGITSSRFLQNKELNDRLKAGTLARIGIEGEFDTEVVLSLDPELIFISPYKRGGYDAIKDTGVPMLAYLGYKELSALGQAEWIKLVGMLLGVEEEAKREFARVEREYNKLANMVERRAKSRPTVMSGEMHSGNWYVVGGASALARLFNDAGAEYFMKNDSESGGYYIDFETVYAAGHDADYWRIANSHAGEFSYETLLQSDVRYRDFKALKERNVLYCNLRRVPFYENTPMEPDVVLADLIKVFHPTLMVSHKPVYYSKLTK
ncbi:MAG: ABC transporter substrate-binding protein [Rikenellaceae bacterium]